MRRNSPLAAAVNTGLHAGADRPIYYFDTVHDYPAIGGIVEFSQILFKRLKKRYGQRLISATEAATRLGAPDASMPYVDRERHIADLLALVDPHSTFFFPNFYSPVSRQPGRIGPRVINVVHDVQFAHLPELFSAGRLGWLNRAFAQIRENADHVVFISETAKQQYIELFGAPRQHAVIYNPIDIDRNASGTVDDGAPFLLASVHHHPHKNFAGLLALFAELAERSSDLKLVVTGHGGERFAEDLSALPESVRARVRHLGYVPRRALDGLYRRARAFVTLSRFEGFNMSAAEAASHGTPLILSDLPVHRELFSGQACFVDAMSPSVAAVADYLAAKVETGEPWPLRSVCDPAAVGRAYASVIDACSAPENESVLGIGHRRTRARETGFALPRHAAAKVFAQALLSTTMMVGAAGLLIQVLAPAPALADGGRGGGYGSGVPQAAGGSGYMGAAGDDGPTGGAGSPYFGGGGGGAGGGAGGLAGNGAGGAAPGSGGAGGTAGSWNGSDGGTIGGLGSGGGGGGGFHGNGFTGVLGIVDLAGGHGGNGGNAHSATLPGGGGGGGAGGYGAVITGPAQLDSSINVTAGNGGDGGFATHELFRGGGGGDGGVGIQFHDTDAEFSSSGTIAGGHGGAGGAGNGNNAAAAGGDGGNGGAGIAGSGMEIINRGTVSGGNGGLGGASPSGTAGANGTGGDGIFGTNLTITNGGTIAGGESPSGVRANAITFNAGLSNFLTFENATSGLIGNIAINGGGLLMIDQSNGVDTTIANVITGHGSIFIRGPGTIELTGANTYTGATAISDTTLAVNGSIAGTAVVWATGTLKGTGTLNGGVTVTAGGIHAPGNSIGTQTVIGSYNLEAGSILEIETNAAGQSDKVIVRGSVSLTGSILRVLAETGTYAPSTDYLIIDNDGADAVSGIFGGLTSNLAFLTPSVSYNGGDGNDVVLRLTRNATDFADVANSPNQRAVAAALDRDGAGNALFDAIVPLDADGANLAFSTLSGELHATLRGTLLQDSRHVRGAILSRLAQHSGAGAGKTGPATVAARDPAPEGRMALGAGTSDDADLPREAGTVFWTQGYGAWGSHDGNGNANGVDRTLGGFVSGVDASLSRDWRIGVATGYAQSDLSANQVASSATIESYHLAAYAGGRIGDFALRTGASWTWHDIDTDRMIVFAGLSETAEASYDGDTGQVFAEVSLPMGSPAAALEPFAGVALLHTRTDGFSEKGGETALTGLSNDEDIAYSTLGLRAAMQIRREGLLLAPRLSVAWQHAFGHVAPSAGLAFTSTGSAFTITGVPIASDSALIEAGLDITLSPDAMLGISYHGQLANDAEDHGISGKINLRF